MLKEEEEEEEEERSEGIRTCRCPPKMLNFFS
jgi:hypothetical protein